MTPMPLPVIHASTVYLDTLYLGLGSMQLVHEKDVVVVARTGEPFLARLPDI